MRATRTILLTLALMVLTTGLVYASGGEGHADSGALLKDFLYRVFNFAIVVGVLVYFLSKPLKKGLSGRRNDIEKALADSEQVKLAAEAKFAEYDQKLASANAEIAEISSAIKREGELEKEKIIASARETAIKIEQDAESAAALEIAKARKELQTEAVRLAVELAEELLKTNFTSEDDTRLIDEYMQKVGELH
jgi:F-type H+-transporting ATPase subunit b